MRVLIIEQSEDMIDVLKDALADAGFELEAATSLEEGAASALQRPFDTVIVDAGLPQDALLSFIEQIRKGSPGTSFIFTSALPYIDPRLRGEDVVAIIDKPFGLEELLLALDRAREWCKLQDERKHLLQELAQASGQLEKLRQELMEYQRLATVGRLSAGGAHEIKNLLGIINVSAHYLRKRIGESDEKVQKHLDTITRQVARCNRIVLSLMSLSKPLAGEEQKCDLRQILDEVLLLLEHQLAMHQIRVSKEYEGKIYLVKGEPNDLKHVFINLVLNAQDAMPEGGEVRVRIAQEGAWVRADVEDTGCGIPEEYLDKIFERFFTTKTGKGTGLGLAICKEIIESYGGKIEVTSKLGEGSKFSVFLPALT